MKALIGNITATSSRRSTTRHGSTLVLLAFSVIYVCAQSGLKSAMASSLTSTRIDIKSANSSDCMWLITNAACTHSYDNGWDGIKILGPKDNVQIYAQEADRTIYQVDALNNIDKTNIGFRANADNDFTMVFTHQNLAPTYTSIYLYDKITNSLVNVTASGSQYSFQAAQTGQCELRFKIYTCIQSYTQDLIVTEQTNEKMTESISMEKSSNGLILHNKSGKTGEVSVFTESGRCIASQRFDSDNDTQMSLQISAGMIVARVLTDDKEVKIFKVLFR
jgi:hypothetical protein